MYSALRSARRALLTPSTSQAMFTTRGFRARDHDAQRALECVGVVFLTGYGHAAETANAAETERRLERIDRPVRGFAYEGAAMAFTMLKGLGLVRRTDPLSDLLGAGGAKHIYMVHVGIGWALARLPVWRRPAVMPGDPLLSWLMLDGYGFHQAYFRTRQWVDGQRRPEPRQFPGMSPAYAGRAVDQGVGRALWFVHGADAGAVAAAIDRYPPRRRADLYSGAGLAATYAGAVDEAGLRKLRDAAGPARPSLAQGSAFAAKARERAGLLTDATTLGTAVLCGATAQEAAAVTDVALEDLPPDGLEPAYEVWRRRIADHFTANGEA
jgi:hypothetical protein